MVNSIDGHRGSYLELTVNELWLYLDEEIAANIPHLATCKWGLKLGKSGYALAHIKISDFLHSFPDHGRDPSNRAQISDKFMLKCSDGLNKIVGFGDLSRSENALDFLLSLSGWFSLKHNEDLYIAGIKISKQLSMEELLMLVGEHQIYKRGKDKKSVLPERNISEFLVPALSHYFDVASKIYAESDLVTTPNSGKSRYPLSCVVKNVHDASKDGGFVFISGPSWSGKTQHIYVLDRLSKHPMTLEDKPCPILPNPAFHCVFHFITNIMKNVTGMQQIYQAQHAESLAFINAIRADYDNIDLVLAEISSRAHFTADFASFLDTLKIDKKQLQLLVDKKDNLEELKDFYEENIPTSLRLSTEFINQYSQKYSWKSLGVLDMLIERRRNGKNLDSLAPEIEFFPMSLENFRQKYVSIQETPVVVCLDEFNLSLKDTNAENRQIFMLNFLRLVPFVAPAVLGTNARVATVVIPASTKFEGSCTYGNPWCRIVLKLPLADFNTIDMPFKQLSQQLSPEIFNWLQQSCGRPGILNLFLESIDKTHPFGTEKLQESFAESLSKMITAKQSLRSVDTLDGYFQMLFSNFSVNSERKHYCSTEMIHTHLAHMIPNIDCPFVSLPTVLSLNKDVVQNRLVFNETTGGCDFVFEPKSVFLDVRTDELTQMIMFSDWSLPGNSSKLWSYSKKDKGISISALKQKLLESIEGNPGCSIFSLPFRVIVEMWHKNRSDNNHLGNYNRSWNKMQNLINGSFIKASAAAGPTGDNLENFLLKFASELSVVRLKSLSWNKECLSLLESLKKQLVPYVIAGNYMVSTEFRAIPNVFTGSLPDLTNHVQLDGLCIPDWVSDLKPVANTEDILGAVQRNAKTLSQKADAQMFITYEMKNYAKKAGSTVLKAVLRRAAIRGRNLAEQWPENHTLPIHHLHLFCVSSLAEFKDLELIHSKCSHVIKLLKLTYDLSSNELGLIDLFKSVPTVDSEDSSFADESTYKTELSEDHGDECTDVDELKGKKAKLAQDSSSYALGLADLFKDILILERNDTGFGQESTDIEVSDGSGDECTEADAGLKGKKAGLSNLNQIAKLTPATSGFPHTTVIIISLKCLFQFRFESV